MTVLPDPFDEGPTVEAPPQGTGGWGSPARSLAVSASALLAILLLRLIRIPLLNRDQGSVFLGTAFELKGHLRFMSLGLSPLVAGFVLVELMALAVPA